VIEPRWFLDNDWYAGGIPANVQVGREVYLDTSYSFAAFHSWQRPGMMLGDASGVYDRTNFFVGPQGMVTVGPYTCLNATTIICNKRIEIGAHCLLAWGVVLSDTSPWPAAPRERRRTALRAAAADPMRQLPAASHAQPVVLEDNVWIGFDSVILPGVRLGRGCIIGCKTVITENVPPYAVVVGTPPRIVRTLEPDDDEATRERVRSEYDRAWLANTGGTKP
jgi:acetyltransferase-like isoleucine patch superfamily enzyme